MLKFLRIERPTRATLRSSLTAASITCWTRWMLEAKEVTMIRPSQRENFSQQGRADARLRGRHARAGRRWSSRRRAAAAPRGRSRPGARCRPGGRRPGSGRTCSRRSSASMPSSVVIRTPRMSGIECARWTSSSSKGPRLDLLPRRQLLQRRVAELVLVELGADHADRQQAAVDHRRHRRSRAARRAAPRRGPRGRG